MNIDKVYFSNIHVTTFYKEYFVPGKEEYHQKRKQEFLKNAFVYYSENGKCIDIFSKEVYKKTFNSTHVGEFFAIPERSLYEICNLLYGEKRHDISKKKVLKIADKVLAEEFKNRNKNND